MEKEINKFHALQLFTDTFVAETVHLTNEAQGVYIRLLCFSWTKNTKPFTADEAYRICYCRSKECEKIVQSVLNEFFINDDGNYTQKRLVKEHEYLVSKYKRRSEAGKKGGLAKRDNATSKNVAPIPRPSPIPNNIYTPMFEDILTRGELEKEKFIASKGDVLIWHSRLMHRGTVPNNPDLWREAVILHYSGISHRPDMPEAEQHNDGGWFFPIYQDIDF